MATPRIPISEDVATTVLFDSDRTCCVCRERGKRVQIHHIDENPSNNDPVNLAVLCFECHEETQIKGGFGRRLDARQVVQFRNDWIERVQKRRDFTDRIAAARGALVPEKPLPEVFCDKELLDSRRITNYIQTLPAIRRDAHCRSRRLWESGNTPNQTRGRRDVSDVLEQILATLAS
jgi:hypothetical protein